MKSIFKSKTFWVNFIAGVISILTMINPELLGIFGISPDKEATVLKAIGAIVALLNVILRIFTNQAVSLNPPKV